MVKKLIIFLIIVGVAAVGAEIISVAISHNAFNFKTFLIRFPAAASGYLIAKLGVCVIFSQYQDNPFMVHVVPVILAFVCALSLRFFSI